MTKKCCTCKKIISVQQFHRNARTQDGYAIRCKPCHKIKNRESRQRNCEAVNARNRASYHRNKAARRATQLKYERKFALAASNGDRRKHASLLYEGIRSRAKRYGIPFNLERADIVIPELCPVLGLKLERHLGKALQINTATVDRIVPDLGYVKGNIIVVSMKANVIKNNATPNEVLAVGRFYKNLISSVHSVS